MAKKASFPGFSAQMPKFFRALDKNNDRAWFAPRKGIYEEHVRAPMVELVGRVNEELRLFAADHCVAEPARAIYRLYRDTRFSKDKTPYKTHIGATFHCQGLSRHGGAGFYFGVSHRCVEIAGGVYMPGPDELLVLRNAIADDPAAFLKLISDPKLTRSMGKVVGQTLKRLPKTHQAQATSPVAAYLRHKQLYWYVELPAKVALTPKLAGEVVARFRLMGPALAWMNRALLAARAEEGAQEQPRRPEPMF